MNFGREWTTHLKRMRQSREWPTSCPERSKISSNCMKNRSIVLHCPVWRRYRSLQNALRRTAGNPRMQTARDQSPAFGRALDWYQQHYDTIVDQARQRVPAKGAEVKAEANREADGQANPQEAGGEQ
jgi:hypothetical protein